MTNTVKIILDNYVNNTCYPGQTLSGRVECFFLEEKNVRAIRIKFKGRAKTKWNRKRGKSNVRYWAEEIYFNQEYNLISGDGDDLQLDAGRHTYPFSYILPQTLPSSFEGKYGKIRYSIKATVDRPWKLDYEDKVLLNVFSPLDLNHLPGLQNPYAVSVDKQVSSGCCRTDPLTFNVSLPATGYAAGQEMNIGAFIENMSNASVECVQFRIIQMITFISHHPSIRERYKEFPVTSCAAGAIGAHAEKSWTSSLTIPAINFPNLLPCSIINATYRVEAEVVLPFPHSNLSFNIPITIGIVPLSGINMGLPGPPPQENSYPSNFNATAPSATSFTAGKSSTSGFEDIDYPPGANMTSPL